MHIVQRSEQATIVLTIHGRLEFTTLLEFQQALVKAENTCPDHIILDLSHTTFIDSGAIGRLVATHHRLQRSSIRFTLASQQGQVDRCLKAVNVHTVIPMKGSVEEALNVEPPQQPDESDLSKR